jgi:hypothetical protein
MAGTSGECSNHGGNIGSPTDDLPGRRARTQSPEVRVNQVLAGGNSLGGCLGETIDRSID